MSLVISGTYAIKRPKQKTMTKVFKGSFEHKKNLSFLI